MVRPLGVAVLSLLVAVACGGSEGTRATQTVPPSLAPGLTVECQPGGGRTGLVGIGGSTDAFAGVHGPQDQAHLSNFGSQYPFGGSEFTVSCLPAAPTTVVAIQRILLKRATARDLMAAIARDGMDHLVPPDAVQAADQLLAQCELLTYRSAQLAAVPGASDPTGTIQVEFLTGYGADGAPYNPSAVYQINVDTGIFSASC